MSLALHHKKINDLIPFVNNSRTHTDEQVIQICSSIKEFGFTNPVLVDESNSIIAGHGRILAARKLDIEEVPCITLDNLTDAQKKAYVIADNKLALNAGWNEELLRIELEGLKDLDFDISVIGFSEDELNDIMPPEEVQGFTDEDAIPEDVEAVTKLGDLWILGDHRLLCGDSTDIEQVERLMDGAKADMVFTDPPYNIGFKGTLGCTSKDGKIITVKDGYSVPNSQHPDIKNDNKKPEKFNKFIQSILRVIKKKCVGGWYICFSSKTLNELLTPLVENGMEWKSLIIWNKNQSPMGGGHFRKKYEPIAYGYFNNFFYGKEYAEDDVWDMKRTLKNDLHPTMKPVDLIIKAIGYSSNSGGSVLDLFLGSGSTLIACEKTNRKCYGMELDPHYCDVIVKRWEEYTGNKAALSD